MKKITKPAEKEESVYYSDFSGKLFKELTGPPVELKISFNYGSVRDGASFTLHLDDDEINPIIELIKEKLTSNTKKNIKKKLKEREKYFDDSVQMRDWDHCDLLSNDMSLLRYLVGMEGFYDE
jgi:hypothetical protein